MIFLIDYDRDRGEIVSFRRFDNSERDEASEKRLQLELDNSRNGIFREVVLLEAKDEIAVRRTHRRYFETLDELLEPSLS